MTLTLISVFFIWLLQFSFYYFFVIPSFHLHILWVFLNTTHLFYLVFSTSELRVRDLWVVFVDTPQNIAVKYILWKIGFDVTLYCGKAKRSFAFDWKCYGFLTALLYHHWFDDLYRNVPEYLIFVFALTDSYFDVTVFTQIHTF